MQEADEGATLRVVADLERQRRQRHHGDQRGDRSGDRHHPDPDTPVISGTAQEGQTLTATAAVANDSDATVTYQWQADHGSGFVNIASATGLSYVAQEADEGATLRVVATSSDTDGSGTTATSAATAAVTDISADPDTPVISGTAQEGQTLTATAAVANDSDATVTYQWQADHGSGFVNIASATGLSYVAQEADEGATLRVVATSADSDGSGTTATSAATAAVTDISPTLSTPVISGTTQPGQTLTATAASADDSDASVTYQWEADHGIRIRSDRGCNGPELCGDIRRSRGAAWRSSRPRATPTAAAPARAARRPQPSPWNCRFRSSGTAQEGQTLSAVVSGGTASSYQWQFSSDGGSTWNDISGATAQTYVVQETDETNSSGWRRAAARAMQPAPPQAQWLTSPPP